MGPSKTGPGADHVQSLRDAVTGREMTGQLVDPEDLPNPEQLRTDRRLIMKMRLKMQDDSTPIPASAHDDLVLPPHHVEDKPGGGKQGNKTVVMWKASAKAGLEAVRSCETLHATQRRAWRRTLRAAESACKQTR